MPDQRTARRGLAIYFTVLILLSATLEGLLIRAGDFIGNHPGLILTLMWSPAIASIVARLAMREGIRDVSFRWGGAAGTRATLIAWLFPVAVGTLAYGVAWSAGLAVFNPPEYHAIAAPVARLGYRLLGVLTLGTLSGIVSAGGEEIGWRGYMLTRLVDAGVPAPLLTSGLIWAAWHLPLIVTGLYAAGPQPLLSAGLFTVVVASAGILIGKLRLVSGSVWPAVIAHASWNAVIQGAFDWAARSGEGALWVGESGVLVAAVIIPLVALIGATPSLRAPAPGG